MKTFMQKEFEPKLENPNLGQTCRYFQRTKDIFKQARAQKGSKEVKDKGMLTDFSPNLDLLSVGITASESSAQLFIPRDWNQIPDFVNPQTLDRSKSAVGERFFQQADQPNREIIIHAEEATFEQIVSILAALWKRGQISGTNIDLAFEELKRFPPKQLFGQSGLTLEANLLPAIRIIQSQVLDDDEYNRLKFLAQKNGLDLLWEVEAGATGPRSEVERVIYLNSDTLEQDHDQLDIGSPPVYNLNIETDESEDGSTVTITGGGQLFMSDDEIKDNLLSWQSPLLVVAQTATHRFRPMREDRLGGAFQEDIGIHALRGRALLSLMREHPQLAEMVATLIKDISRIDRDCDWFREWAILFQLHDLREIMAGDVYAGAEDQGTQKTEVADTEAFTVERLVANGDLPPKAVDYDRWFNRSSIGLEELKTYYGLRPSDDISEEKLFEGIIALAELVDRLAGAVFFQQQVNWLDYDRPNTVPQFINKVKSLIDYLSALVELAEDELDIQPSNQNNLSAYQVRCLMLLAEETMQVRGPNEARLATLLETCVNLSQNREKFSLPEEEGERIGLLMTVSSLFATMLARGAFGNVVDSLKAISSCEDRVQVKEKAQQGGVNLDIAFEFWLVSHRLLPCVKKIGFMLDEVDSSNLRYLYDLNAFILQLLSMRNDEQSQNAVPLILALAESLADIITVCNAGSSGIPALT